MTAGDVDADWVAAYASATRRRAATIPTPGQTVVDEVGQALGVDYADGEELAASGED